MSQSAQRDYAISSIAGAALVAAAMFGTDASSSLGSFGFIGLPGLLLSALVFPEGFHSGSSRGFLFLAVVFDGLVYGVVIFGLWRLIRRVRSWHGSP